MSRKIKVSDIKIKQSFLETTPHEEKLSECRNNYLTYNRQDRVIVINHVGYLIDGYVMYLILKELGIDEAQIKISDRRKKRWYRKDISSWNKNYRNHNTTYIYGVHPNTKQNPPKEYTWRVADSKREYVYENVLPGDTVLCQTKYGLKPVIVTRIETLNKCPIDMRIRKFYRKLV